MNFHSNKLWGAFNHAIFILNVKGVQMAQRIPNKGQFALCETRTNKDKTMIVLGIAIMVLFILIILSSVAWGNSPAHEKSKGTFEIPGVLSELQQGISSSGCCLNEIEACGS